MMMRDLCTSLVLLPAAEKLEDDDETRSGAARAVPPAAARSMSCLCAPWAIALSHTACGGGGEACGEARGDAADALAP